MLRMVDHVSGTYINGEEAEELSILVNILTYH